MKLHILITDEKTEKAVREVAKRNRWSLTKTGLVGIEYYLKARKALKG